MAVKMGKDVILYVRPVYIDFIHEYVYEGPCRFGSGDELTPEYDKMQAEEMYQRFISNVKAHLPTGVEMLEPIRVRQQTDDFRVHEEDLQAICKGMEDTDFYFVSTGGRCNDMVIDFARLCKKPLACMAGTIATTIVTTALKARGFEAYAFLTWEEAAAQLKILRVRKALASTRILTVNRFGGNVSYISTMDSFIDLEHVTKKLGVRFRSLNLHELIDQSHCVDPASNPTTPGRVQPNINEEDVKEINRLTDEIIAGAEECTMDRQYVFNSMKIYYLIKKELAYYDCNAFTAPCPDACATRRLNEEKFTFCWTHSLLNEEGIPSACEYDIDSVVSKVVLSNIAGKPTYMGNNTRILDNEGKLGLPELRFLPAEEYDAVRDIPDLMVSFHSVPNRKMRGYNAETAPYAIRSFAYSGWGATMRYDFSRDIGQPITLLRFSPNCDKMFVGKGVIKGGIGYHNMSCSLGVWYQVANAKEFSKKQMEFGNHLPMVFGDYSEELIALGEALGIEVVTA